MFNAVAYCNTCVTIGDWLKHVILTLEKTRIISVDFEWRGNEPQFEQVFAHQCDANGGFEQSTSVGGMARVSSQNLAQGSMKTVPKARLPVTQNSQILRPKHIDAQMSPRGSGCHRPVRINASVVAQYLVVFVKLKWARHLSEIHAGLNWSS